MTTRLREARTPTPEPPPRADPPEPATALPGPTDVRSLALTSHYGQTMVGSWDGVGIVASLALAIGGVLVGAWGFSRRDLRG